MSSLLMLAGTLTKWKLLLPLKHRFARLICLNHKRKDPHAFSMLTQIFYCSGKEILRNQAQVQIKFQEQEYLEHMRDQRKEIINQS